MAHLPSSEPPAQPERGRLGAKSRNQVGPQGRGEAAPPCPLRVERIHAVLCWPPALGPRQGVVGLGTPRLTASCGVARGSQGGTTAEDQGCARELSRGAAPACHHLAVGEGCAKDIPGELEQVCDPSSSWAPPTPGGPFLWVSLHKRQSEGRGRPLRRDCRLLGVSRPDPPAPASFPLPRGGSSAGSSPPPAPRLTLSGGPSPGPPPPPLRLAWPLLTEAVFPPPQVRLAFGPCFWSLQDGRISASWMSQCPRAARKVGRAVTSV